MRLSSLSRSTWLIALTIYILIFGFIFSDAIRLRKARRLPKVKRKIGINFNCTDRPVGYYADVEFGCRVFHICDTFGRRVPMRCPAHTLFNQLYRVCDWADNVDCQSSSAWYHLNEIVFDKAPEKEKSVNSIESDSSLAASGSASTTTTTTGTANKTFKLRHDP